MATNKNALLRLQILDECFSNFQRRYTIDDLIDTVAEKLSEHYDMEMTISLRQIREDIKFMRSSDGFDAPIVTYREGKGPGYYQYDDSNENRGFSIHKKPLTQFELDILEDAVMALSRTNSVTGDANLNSVLTRLESEFGINKPEKRIIHFEENEHLKGLEHLNPLYNFIVKKQVLKVLYKSFGTTEEQTFTISPYYLKEFNNRWFFYGWSHEKGILYNMPLDRIISYEISDEKYSDNEINFDEYFDEIIGVTNYNDKKVEMIVLKFSEHRFPYILSKPIHRTQEIVRERTIKFNLKINREFVSMLLSFGKDVTVIQPESLRDEMKNILKEMNENYK